MAADPGWAPDFGPKKLHPSAGATVVGARWPLIAFNEFEDAGSVSRESNCEGRSSVERRPSCVKAIGVELRSQGLVQVSMNLTNHEETPLHKAFAAVQQAAAAHGGRSPEPNLIGLVPEQALIETGTTGALSGSIPRGRQVLEARFETAESRSAIGATGRIPHQSKAQPSATRFGASDVRKVQSRDWATGQRRRPFRHVCSCLGGSWWRS